MTSISITASQNFKRNAIPCPVSKFDKAEKNETVMIKFNSKMNELKVTDHAKNSSDKVEKIAKSLKKNFSNKKLPSYKNIESSRKIDNRNDSFKRNSKVHKEENTIPNTRTLSKKLISKSKREVSLNKSFHTDSLNQSKNYMSHNIKEKETNRINTFKIKI